MTGVQTCALDRKSTRLNSSHTIISYAVFCLKKKKKTMHTRETTKAYAHDGVYCMRVRSSGYVPTERLRCTRACWLVVLFGFFFFFFNDPATPEIYPFSLHDALPI